MDFPIRVYPGLVPAVNEARLSVAYLYWTVARDAACRRLAPDGARTRGWRRQTLVKFLANTLGRSASVIRKQLANGNRVFWRSASSNGVAWVHLLRPDAVAANLALRDAGRLVATYYTRELRDPRGRVSNRRWKAVCIDSVMPPKAKRIARQHAAQRAGVSRSALLRVERDGVALHHDGHGVLPVLSTPAFEDWTALMPSLPGGRRPNPAAIAAAIAPDCRPLSRHGLFAHGDELLRQAPKTYQASHNRRQRHFLRPAQQGNGTSPRVRAPVATPRVGSPIPTLAYVSDDKPPKGKAFRNKAAWIIKEPGRNRFEVIANNPNAVLRCKAA